eukprot:4189636-Amphidinium_carterae.1
MCRQSGMRSKELIAHWTAMGVGLVHVNLAGVLINRLGMLVGCKEEQTIGLEHFVRDHGVVFVQVNLGEVALYQRASC